MFRIIIIACLSSVFSLSKAQTTAACACCAEPYRQFDFWVGDWVTTANGQPAGTNRIKILQDSCVLQENWISASGGYTGTSYNYYNAGEKLWHQIWVDNQGQSLHLSGGWNGEAMVLESGEMVDRQGQNIWHRITWTPRSDGSVRQHWESSSDGISKWTTVFDGIYVRKE